VIEMAFFYAAVLWCLAGEFCPRAQIRARANAQMIVDQPRALREAGS
jgi:hypothetical protein